ncbi:bifunctional proline dehydrogenase/L-glutamate gamma-semialdehyde dehydrogenase PutA [Govanella unica]|uniref:Bifunctional protein PutA n=1 Tax=Govanella unica TaxID=2975056 RepID=A0A9X3Z6F1_9PROT|nr:bifunctional proline dehydrogenase/L-glutamate gamma-semialdehyde dehydrogenase PutA [Govania unica]MDA5193155.1 bifunctional proline dehydrogenase/L-glutamate gamma-semialdehyde dehydrogenase PutA [Govania unica]
MAVKKDAGAVSLDTLRNAIREATHRDENLAVDGLLETLHLSSGARLRIVRQARLLVEAARGQSHRQGSIDAFMHEFGLSNKEGVALMCLAEALLRVPDAGTADKLIAEKIASGSWADHRGRSDSLFVNASTWALMLTGRVVELDRETSEDLGGWFGKLVTRVGEPIIRKASMQAMRIMGDQFVLGRTIDEGLNRAQKVNPPHVRNSFDMLGEGARTAADAKRYFEDYRMAIHAIGAKTAGQTVAERQGISVKLSALHPRYDYRTRDRVMAELLPVITALAKDAKAHNLGFSIDAEEARRLDISLDLFEAMARDPELAGWDGLGLVVQAYQKRAPFVIDWLVALGRETGRRFMTRLVKGAYWDTEIKHAQEGGFEDYPVYTRKASTDLSYMVAAERMLAATDVLFPQFATHNAHTVAAILEMAKSGQEFEFQRLHGMGELLYDVLPGIAGHTVPIRIYAPVGAHKDLLPYLVRRLLENGANSSFVNRFMDEKVPVAELVIDPVAHVEKAHPRRHPRIARPCEVLRESGLNGGARDWAQGFDLDDGHVAEPLLALRDRALAENWDAGPIIGGVETKGAGQPVLAPADTKRRVGTITNATKADVDAAFAKAVAAQPTWDALGGAARADCLDRMADLLEQNSPRLMALIGLEAGRTVADTLSEVREAVDFCRYYALKARESFAAPMPLPGPTGELNQLSLHGRGVFACISPWNFPLAIFAGQIAAALAAGNAVLAKPAEQTPLIGAEAVRLFHKAGVPGDVLHFLPGDGATVGAAITGDPRLAGVAFTGSTETAQIINRVLAGRDGPIATLIAETGGQNAMIVDSTALPEQVVDDAVISAFQSAGQRCSALRVLFLQDDVADGMITMLKGAMDEILIGDPLALKTDVGPVIDHDARELLVKHVERMTREAKILKVAEVPAELADGSYFAPHLVELQTLDQLPREVFGPVLHVIRFKATELDKVIASIRKTGYGLTLGVHTRIEATANEIFKGLNVGNSYINRNMVGAVVGVQPFGGQGLSGTGPKAGGPHYLLRFATEKTFTVNVAATGGNAALFCLPED